MSRWVGLGTGNCIRNNATDDFAYFRCLENSDLGLCFPERRDSLVERQHLCCTSKEDHCCLGSVA